MGENKRRKAAADAIPGEIFPKRGQGPLQDDVAEVMKIVAAVIEEALPNYHMTMFLAEKEPTGGRDHARFNYLSTVRREDMLAVLKAWIAKQEREPDVETLFAQAPAGRA
jgi:hypothetical protein